MPCTSKVFTDYEHLQASDKIFAYAVYFYTDFTQEKFFNMNNFDNIAVLCGGDGREREVSLNSGHAVYNALRDAGFHAQLLDLRSLDEVSQVKDFDMAFIAMHGDWGEGGELQSKLEAMGIPYTGSGPEASSLAMNKWRAREVFVRENITVPEGILLPDNLYDAIIKLGPNIVVKPCSGGSTVGISIVRDATPEKLHNAVRIAQESYNSDVMLEKYINGREITAAVLELDNTTKALPVIEIKPRAGFYDYRNKYTAGAVDYIIPAEIDDELTSRISKIAVKAHETLGCRSYSRSDFRLDESGNVYILEVNTAPGMTATSLVPKAANAAGISMPELVRMIINSSYDSSNAPVYNL